MRIVITGANGHLGSRLISSLYHEHDVMAVVRSDRAREKLYLVFPTIKILVLNLHDVNALKTIFQNADVLVHLIGIIKQSTNNSFADAHERSCSSLIEAARHTNLTRIIYLSIVGANPAQDNACLSSKGKAEKLLRESDLDATIIKIPMVLGEGDYASTALKKSALKNLTFTFRADSLEQPIYAGDVIAAIKAALLLEAPDCTLQIAGITSISRRELLFMANKVLHKRQIKNNMVVSIPIVFGMALAYVCEQLPTPPISRAMLGVLDHDDDIDNSVAVKRLNLKLTSLSETLDKVLV